MPLRKLTLDPDALTVESFSPSAHQAGVRGTVQGAARTDACPVGPATSLGSDPFQCGTAIACTGNTEYSQPSCYSCIGDTCINTCWASCAGNPTCGLQTCGFTLCVDTCDICLSFTTEIPIRC